MYKTNSVDRRQSRILSLQNDTDTFTSNPDDLQEFQDWKKTFKLQSQTDNISQLLSTNEKLREVHTTLGELFPTSSNV